MDEVYTSLPLLREVVDQSSSFAEVGASYTPVSMIFNGDGEPERLRASLVSPGFFGALRVAAPRGRVFNANDNRVPGGHRLVILSHEMWVTRFGGSDAAIGSILRLNGQPYEVVGVLPGGFADFPNASQQTDVWIPLMMLDEILGRPVLENIQARAFAVVARLNAEASLETTRAELATISSNLREAYPDVSGNSVFRVRSVGEQYFSDFRAPTLALVFGAALLLIIGTANVASLLLARSSERRHEVAVRAALGASQTRLARQLLGESLVVRCWVAAWGLRFIAGRGIEETDRADTQPVVVLSESLANALWPADDSLGKIVRRWNNDMWATVVGVVEDARMSGIVGEAADFSRDVYFSFQQRPARDWALLARAPEIESRVAELRGAGFLQPPRLEPCGTNEQNTGKLLHHRSIST